MVPVVTTTDHEKSRNKVYKEKRVGVDVKLGRTFPYSFSYVACTHSPGSFPGLRTGTKAAPSLRAITGPMRKPRASSAMTTSIFLLGEVGMVSDTR